MKGLELPINIIIVIAIAVLVLVIIAAYFMTNVTSNSDLIAARGAWDRYCGQARMTGCTYIADSGLTMDVNGKQMPLSQICNIVHGIVSPPDCQFKCCGTRT